MGRPPVCARPFCVRCLNPACEPTCADARTAAKVITLVDFGTCHRNGAAA